MARRILNISYNPVDEWPINQVGINMPGPGGDLLPANLQVTLSGAYVNFPVGTTFLWDFDDPYSAYIINVTEQEIITSESQEESGVYYLNFVFDPERLSVTVNDVRQGEDRFEWGPKLTPNVITFDEGFRPAKDSKVVFYHTTENRNYISVRSPSAQVTHTYTVAGKYVARLIATLPNGIILEQTKSITVQAST